MSASRCIFALGLAILCQTSAILAGDAVPVLLWGGQTTSTAANPLQKTSSAEFEKLLEEKVGGGRPVIVFVRDNFCSEDLSQNKKVLSQLDTSNSLTYLPSVESPLSVLELFKPYNISTEEKPETISDGQLVLTPVSDLASVPEIYKTLLESSDNLLAFLIGKSCIYSRSERVRREAVENQDSSISTRNHTFQTDNILMYIDEELSIKLPGYNATNLTGEPTVSSSGNGSMDNPLLLLLNYNTTGILENVNEITLGFQFTNNYTGYWAFDGIRYTGGNTTDALMTESGTFESVYFATKFSYHCSLNVSYNSSDIYLYVTALQIEIGGNLTKFSDAYDCVGFTTIPIWTGIFVTAILALITIWGLTMIMDIRTMDRFDDPKGKTITIAVSE